MAINYNKGQIPKAPSNSTGMGATPGTQQTALNNVGGLNLNPNMPSAPQMQKRQRSSFQQSLGMQPPSPAQQAPRPPVPSAMPRQAAVPTQTRPVVSRMQNMDEGRGYNIFSGMDADQINSMNQSMGLSNMTALPSLVSPVNKFASMNLQQPGRQFSSQLMSGDGSGDGSGVTKFSNAAGNTTYEYDPETGLITTVVSGPAGDLKKTKTREEFLESYEEYGGDFKKEKQEQNLQDLIDQVASDLEANKTPEEIQEEQEAEEMQQQKTEQEQYFDALPFELQQQSSSEYVGIDPDKKQAAKDNLDDLYATQLQQALAGIDRQAAMMGTFGSGSHSTMLNNAISTALAQMAREYNALDILDIQAGELDEQQKIENAIKILGLDDAQTESMLNQYGKINEEIIAPIAAQISGFTSGGAEAGLIKELGDLALEIFQEMSAEGASFEEIAAKISVEGQKIVQKAQQFSFTG